MQSKFPQPARRRSWKPIRKISSTGEVTTVAFKASQMLSRTHFSAGSYIYFYVPVRIAVDAGGTLYVADPNDHVVRKFEPNGQVTVLAGTVSENNAGYMDGAGTSAQFYSLDAIALERQNQAYVLDGDGVNKRIRRVGSDGTVSTVVQSPRCSMFETGGQSPCSATHLAVDATGGLLVNEFGSMDGSTQYTYSLVRRFTADGLASSVAAGSLSGFGALDGTGGAARFAQPAGLAFGKSGTLYVTDSLNHTLRTISAEGVTRTLGMPTQSCYRAEPGKVTETSFCYVTTLALDGAENLYVPTGNRIMKVTPAGDVSLLVDLTAWVYGPRGAGYDQVQGIALDSAGNVYVAMETSGVIFKISPTGQPVVFTGSLHVRGHADGQGTAARFSALGNMTTDASGNFYVVDGKDYPNQGIGPTVRKITPEGVVSTIAGKVDAAPGWVDGARDVARFRVADEPLISSLQRPAGGGRLRQCVHHRPDHQRHPQDRGGRWPGQHAGGPAGALRLRGRPPPRYGQPPRGYCGAELHAVLHNVPCSGPSRAAVKPGRGNTSALLPPTARDKSPRTPRCSGAARQLLHDGNRSARPYRNSAARATRAMCAASTPKNSRSAARVSLRPKPSVPSVTKRRPCGTNARTVSGTART